MLRIKDLYDLLGPGMRLYVCVSSVDSLTIQFEDVDTYRMYHPGNAEAEVVGLLRGQLRTAPRTIESSSVDYNWLAPPEEALEVIDAMWVRVAKKVCRDTKAGRLLRFVPWLRPPWKGNVKNET